MREMNAKVNVGVLVVQLVRYVDFQAQSSGVFY